MENNKVIMSEAYKTSQQILQNLPNHLKNVKCLSNPDKYLQIASSPEEFVQLYCENMADSLMREDIQKNLSQELIDILGINEEYETLEDKIFQTMLIKERKRYLKKAFKEIEAPGRAEEIKRSYGGVYILKTQTICLNPFLENSRQINLKEVYLWTIIHEFAHALHWELFQEDNSVLNEFLSLYLLSSYLPDKIFLKGMTPYEVRNLLVKNFIQTERKNENPNSDDNNTKFQTTTSENFPIEKINRIVDIKMKDKIPTKYSLSSLPELWAESFTFFTLSNEDARIHMPEMYNFICKEILKEEL